MAKSVSTLNSSNQVSQQVTLTNAVVKGLKLDFCGTMQPSGASNAKATIEMDQGAFLTSAAIDLAGGPATVSSSLSARMRDFQLGGEVAYDVSKGALEKYSLALSLDRCREKAVIQAHTGFKAFSVGYFQRFTDQLEVAYRASWNGKAQNMTMEVGAKWLLLGGGFLKAKLDNAGRLGVALASDLRPNVQLTLGASLDTAKLAESGHKVGLSLEYAA